MPRSYSAGPTSAPGGRNVPRMAATAQQRGLIARARSGDEHAYRELVEPYRGELHAHCYRMLGSVHDADDALQDALIRAWRGLPRFQGRSSLRTWLYTIATNACLNFVTRRATRRLPIEHAPPVEMERGLGLPPAEAAWIDPYPGDATGLADGRAAPEARYELRESVELAFVAALQHLPPTQRAVLILRDVLGFSARESADALDTTVPSVNSALQRARQTVERRLPERSQQATLRTLGDRRLRELVERYMRAMQHGDIDTVVGMLAEEAAWSMPPLPAWFHGRAAIAAFLAGGPLSGSWLWRHRATRAGGQPAVGAYTWDDRRGAYVAFALDVLTLDGDRVREITSFITRAATGTTPDYYARFPDQPVDPARLDAVFTRRGLPATIDGADEGDVAER